MSRFRKKSRAEQQKGKIELTGVIYSNGWRRSLKAKNIDCSTIICRQIKMIDYHNKDVNDHLLASE